MRIFNSIAGFLITFLLLAGVLFKSMHWPGAGIMIVLSVSSLALYVFLVAGANISNYKGRGFLQACNGIGGFGASILAIGALFKIMHWPGAGLMMMVGMTFTFIIILLFTILYIVSKEPINFSSGTFFTVVSFGLLLYGISIGGSSKSLLDNVVVNAENIEKNIDFVKNNNSKLRDHFNNIATVKSNQSKQIYELTEILNDYIEDLKSILYEKTDVLPNEVADTISLQYISSKDNYDIPTHILGLANPSSPIKVPGLEEYSAITLKEKLENFNQVVKKVAPESKLIPTKDYDYYNGQLDPWETSMFNHFSLSQVILTLNQIQLEANVICNLILSSNLLKENVNVSDTIN